MEKVIKKTLEEMLLKMEADFNDVSIKVEDEIYRVNIGSDNPSVLIGHHGETIYALQNLLKTLVWKQGKEENFNIVVDIDDYRKRQENNVIQLAQRKAEKVKSSGNEESLPPMSPYFRRIVHLYLRENYENLETESYGEGERRKVVIKLK